jgi:hypothetical protein
MSEQPSVIIHVNGPPLTEQQAAELKERLAAAIARNPRPVILGVSRLTRLRWWCTEHIDALCCWLCDHGQWRAAQAIWRVSRLWQATRRAR